MFYRIKHLKNNVNEQRCNQSLGMSNVGHQDLGNFIVFYFEFYLEFSNYYLKLFSPFSWTTTSQL